MTNNEEPRRPLTLGETRLCPNASCLREYIPFRDKHGNEIYKVLFYMDEDGRLQKINGKNGRFQKIDDYDGPTIVLIGFILDRGNVIRVGVSKLNARSLNDDEKALLKGKLSSIAEARIYTRKNERREENVFAKIFVDKKGNEIAIIHYEDGKAIGRDPIESTDTQAKAKRTSKDYTQE